MAFRRCARPGARYRRRDIDRGPRPRATVPDCAISLMPSGARTASSACSLSGVPVASRVTVSGLTSTTRARKSSAVCSTWVRSAIGARTLTSSSSRWTAAPPSSSTILMTSISLFSCLVICSSGCALGVDDDRHARQVRVLRGPDGEGLDVEPAAAEQRRDAGQDTGLVLDQHGQRVAGHVRPVPLRRRAARRARPGCRRCSRPRRPSATPGRRGRRRSR